MKFVNVLVFNSLNSEKLRFSIDLDFKKLRFPISKFGDSENALTPVFRLVLVNFFTETSHYILAYM